MEPLRYAMVAAALRVASGPLAAALWSTLVQDPREADFFGCSADFDETCVAVGAAGTLARIVQIFDAATGDSGREIANPMGGSAVRSGSATGAEVPLPPAALLPGSALVGVGLMRRRRA